MTIRLIVEYDQPEDVKAFFKHYKKVHIPLVKQTPGLQRLDSTGSLGMCLAAPHPMRRLPRWIFPIRKPSTQR
jgi:uncharacterized protein (TIGR02118 family)